MDTVYRHPVFGHPWLEIFLLPRSNLNGSKSKTRFSGCIGGYSRAIGAISTQCSPGCIACGSRIACRGRGYISSSKYGDFVYAGNLGSTHSHCAAHGFAYRTISIVPNSVLEGGAVWLENISCVEVVKAEGGHCV